MERRVLIATFLAFIVLCAGRALSGKPLPKPAPGGPPAATSARGSAPPPVTGAVPPAAATSAPVTAAPSNAAALLSEPLERDVRVETRDLIAVFTNRGARLKSWRLKHFLDSNKQPQELVEHEVFTQPLPFTLRTPNETLSATLNGALYAVSGAPGAPAQPAPVDLRFEYRDTAGVQAVKEYHFDPSSYIVTLRATVVEADHPIPLTILWGPAIGDVGEVSRYVAKAGGLVFQSGKVVRLTPADLAKQSTYEGDFKYAGVDDNYFMTTALNTGPSRVTYQPVSIPPPDGSKEAPDRKST